MGLEDGHLIRFQHRIREKPRTFNWADPQFAEIAAVLYRKASRQTGAWGPQELIAYFMLVQMDWGAEAAKIELQRFLTTPCDKGDLATAFLLASHAANAYEEAVTGLNQMREQFGLQEIIGIRLAQALAGSGRIPELEALAAEFDANVRFGSWAAEQWARTLLGSGLWEASRTFSDRMDSKPALRSQFQMRAESFTNNERFPYPASFIGLEREERKTKITKKVLELGGITAKQVRGVDARELPEAALALVRAESSASREVSAGAVGCALSHMKVLEAAANSASVLSLVMEDDSVPFIHWSILGAPLELATNWDLVFVNQRMSCADQDELPEYSELVPVWQMLGNRPSGFGGVGTDGYLVTPAGAHKLLDLIEKDGVAGHIDWQLAAYASSGNRNCDGASRSQIKALEMRLRLDAENQINAACLSVPLVCESSHGASTVKDVSRQVSGKEF